MDIERFCNLCGHSFWTKQKELKRGKGRYCSANCNRLSATEYMKTETGWIERRKAKRATKTERTKENARQSVARAVASGKLVKPKTCELCKRPQKLDAHHPDYEMPLVVQWLCRSCHNELHAELVFSKSPALDQSF